MNLRSKEEVFRFVMSEIWSEFMHIHESRQAHLSISINQPECKFNLHLSWIDDHGRWILNEQHIGLNDLCEQNYSMTSWLRTHINQSGAVGPVRQNQPQVI